MEPQQNGNKQRLHLRASTMLLLFNMVSVVFVVMFGRVIPAPRGSVAAIAFFMIESQYVNITLIAAIFALTFLIASMVRRRFQVQYLAELVVAVVWLFGFPEFGSGLM